MLSNRFRRVVARCNVLARFKSTRIKEGGPGFQDFLRQSVGGSANPVSPVCSVTGSDMKYFIETYGCQMNVSDSEVIRSILHENGHTPADSAEEADIVMLNTCAIRENAEGKIWSRLSYFQVCELSSMNYL